MHTLPTLILGLLLGIKHAVETDHIIAVTTLVTEHKNPFRAGLVGMFWGIGHTTSLFLAGILVLVFKISIPQEVSRLLEIGVGIMLIMLGTLTLFRKHHIHDHAHSHEDLTHTHPHTTHHHSHKRPFAIGMIHGFAGSGALMLLVLSTVTSTLSGLYYILVFGFGSIISMSVLSFVLGLPFLFSVNKLQHVANYLRIAAGLLSILLGASLVYTLGFGY